MKDYNFGYVNIEFRTNRIFLLMQILYRLENIEDKINANDSDVPYLTDSVKNFKELIAKNKQGLEEFNRYKDNAENNDMWAEYGEYITSFAQTDIEELEFKNPAMAETVRKLIKTDFFTEVEKINKQYSNEMEKRFIEQTENYKREAENIVGKTNVKKIIYMPFSPKLFNIEPCCLSDKNGNGEYAVQFTIPTGKEEFEESFGMEYTEGIESVILFHEKLHADIPTKSVRHFQNAMQRELDSHLKHTIIELLANGEMGVNIANHSSYFQTTFHIGKIYDGENILTTNHLQDFEIMDNELLHTEANEIQGKGMEHFSKEDMGIVKIRGMMYPYVLMYNSRNNKNQLETVLQGIQRDSQMIMEIYGEAFLRRLQDIEFLKQVQQSVKPYNDILEFAEGMSRELLEIEQVKEFSEQEIGKATINTKTSDKDFAQQRINSDIYEIIEKPKDINELE